MKRSIVIVAYCLHLLLLPLVCDAQDVHNVLRTNILFKDDFREDTTGHFPARWHLMFCNEPVTGKYPAHDYWRVDREDGVPHLASDKILRLVAPIMDTRAYLPDTFTIEVDVFIPDAKSCAEIFFAPRSSTIDSCKRVSFHVMKGGIHFASASHIKPALDRSYPVDFDYTIWHHFELVYQSRKLDGYLDGYHLLSLNDSKFVPASFSLGCVPPVKFSNVVASTTEIMEIVPPLPVAAPPPPSTMDGLMSGNKLVTHDIHFDVNKATVKKESMPFINDLAAWMMANKTVKLRIEGHTDSDGKIPSNILLSHARADAVKTLLVQAGVESERITTEGFGPNKPIASNATKEGKATNRRVEFVKQ